MSKSQKTKLKLGILIASVLSVVVAANLVRESNSAGRSPAQIQDRQSALDALNEAIEDSKSKVETVEEDWSDQEVLQKINALLEMAPPASWRNLKVLKIEKADSIYNVETPSDICQVYFPSKAQDKLKREQDSTNINNAVVVVGSDPWQTRYVRCFPKMHILANQTRKEIEAAVAIIYGNSEVFVFDSTIELIVVGEKPESIFDDPNVYMTNMNRQSETIEAGGMRLRQLPGRGMMQTTVPSSYPPMRAIGIGGGMGALQMMQQHREAERAKRKQQQQRAVQ